MDWIRIPDKTKVRHKLDDAQGVVEGLTELVAGPKRNPDMRTQYRLNVGKPQRTLAAEEDLLILLDDEGLVMMEKETELYRRDITERLRTAFSENRFCRPKTALGKRQETRGA
jgi:hypothetical protein